tara:strand:- start:50 stop:424 length:375 start_codon:yes stop_codon:yes gene_type:complete
MADNSLKNSKGWYNQEQSGMAKQLQHNTWKYKCISQNTAFPHMGINMPKMTNGYNNNVLSNNAPDIESSLFGIGSNNLVERKMPTIPEINNIDSIKFFNYPEKIHIPNPLVIEEHQRPIGPFSS